MQEWYIRLRFGQHERGMLARTQFIRSFRFSVLVSQAGLSWPASIDPPAVRHTRCGLTSDILNFEIRAAGAGRTHCRTRTLP